MKFFEHCSGGSVREMFILMGEMVKSEVVKKAQQTSFMGLLIDEVMDSFCHSSDMLTKILIK